MSLLLGQSGSLSRQDFVQPPLQSSGPNIVAYGSFLQPGPYGSLSIDDRSRFRNTSYTPPLSIDLMPGFMSYNFYDTNPNGNDLGTFPRATFINQQAAAAPSSYAFSSVPSNSASLRALQGVGGKPTMQLAPYGQVEGGPVSSSYCPPSLGYINASGGCVVPPTSSLYNPAERNVYF